MAKDSIKKITKENQRSLQILRWSSAITIGWHWIVTKVVWGWILEVDQRWWEFLLGFIASAITVICCYTLAFFAKTKKDSLGEIYAVDSIKSGMSLYIWDIILVAMFVLVTSTLSAFFWWFLLLIPAYALWKAAGFYFQYTASVAAAPEPHAETKQE